MKGTVGTRCPFPDLQIRALRSNGDSPRYTVPGIAPKAGVGATTIVVDPSHSISSPLVRDPEIHKQHVEHECGATPDAWPRQPNVEAKRENLELGLLHPRLPFCVEGPCAKSYRQYSELAAINANMLPTKRQRNAGRRSARNGIYTHNRLFKEYRMGSHSGPVARKSSLVRFDSLSLFLPRP
jgi:hypothetical protein